MLARFKFGQTVRDEGPQSHLAKNGTPTMGGCLLYTSNKLYSIKENCLVICDSCVLLIYNI